jgi:hypothetical protein
VKVSKFTVLAMITAAAAMGCHKRPPTPVALIPAPLVVTTSPPSVTPPPITPVPAPSMSVVSPPPVSPADIVMEDATRAYDTADYARAVARFEEYLRMAPIGEQRDFALFQLGLIYALPDFPQRDWVKSTTYLKRLLTEHPKSPYQPNAQLLLTLRSEITQLTADKDRLEQRNRQLNTELERLKQIELDGLRRPPR